MLTIARSSSTVTLPLSSQSPMQGAAVTLAVGVALADALGGALAVGVGEALAVTVASAVADGVLVGVRVAI